MTATAMFTLQSLNAWPRISPGVIRGYHSRERLPLVRVPTLIMAGEHDPAGKFTSEQAALLPEGTLVETAIVEGAGAFFPLERPEEYARRALAFLART